MLLLKGQRRSQVNILPFKELKKIVGGNSQINACTHNLLSVTEDEPTVRCTVKLPVKSKADVEHDRTIPIVKINQPGLFGLTSSQNLGIIKVVMVAKTEEKRTKPERGKEVR